MYFYSYDYIGQTNPTLPHDKNFLGCLNLTNYKFLSKECPTFSYTDTDNSIFKNFSPYSAVG